MFMTIISTNTFWKGLVGGVIGTLLIFLRGLDPLRICVFLPFKQEQLAITFNITQFLLRFFTPQAVFFAVELYAVFFEAC
ncbi:hypothetical protein EYB25_009410 [Talaromyces marneffei]|nr:hypothetical protein EYB25_009410 [Talaromyces marneffei]